MSPHVDTHAAMRHARMKTATRFLFLFYWIPLLQGHLVAGTFDVVQGGAVGDGKTDCTTAIQKALDACAPDGGTVHFPPGVYLTKPLVLHSKTTVQLDAGAILQAVTNQADFMRAPGDWRKARSSDFIPFIRGSGLSDVTFTGGGVIDGGGSAWWEEAEKARRITPGYTLPRPNMVSLEHCKNLRFENITLRNSPKFHLVPSDCEDVVVSNVTILAPEFAANTDAIDPSGRRMLFTHCRIDVGDDNIAIKAGKRGGGGFVSEDMLVEDCVFLHGHGMSIGSETAGGVRNVTVRNCTFENTDNGLRIKSDSRRGGIVENITYSNITMKNVDPAIMLTCYYHYSSSRDKNSAPDAEAKAAAAEGGNIPRYRNIRISHLRADCPRGAGEITGLPESCISNVVFDHVQISAAKGLKVRNAAGVRFINSTVTVKEGPRWSGTNAEVIGLAGPEQ